MKGKVQGTKFPKGIYRCRIVDVKAGVSSKGDDLIIVTWEVEDGPRTGQTFKERMVSVSFYFLKGIGEPAGYGDNWDTQNWFGKSSWVTVNYTEDMEQWPRYRHSQVDPRADVEPEPPPEKEPKEADPDSVPF
jgi:hypothetical protein